MENLFAHDSLQRVEPNAKLHAENISKQENEMAGTLRAQEKDAEKKEIQTEASVESNMVDSDEKSNLSSRSELQKKKGKKMEEEQNISPKNKFMGGQLFDAEA